MFSVRPITTQHYNEPITTQYYNNDRCRKRNEISNIEPIKIVWIGVCIALFLWQFVDICQLYFSYATTVNIAQTESTLSELPAITFCFDTFKLFKQSDK